MAGTPPSEKAKRASVYFAIQACSADGEYHEAEKAEILKMAKAMGISEEEVSQLEAMSSEEDRFREKRVKLLFPDGLPHSS